MKLKKISVDESLNVKPDALDLIALNADGSLRDAETMLDQLSLLGKRITTSLVNELVGVVSDEKLLDLLELAMSSETAETVKRARELMDSGVDPIALMSQLAGLIMDIIAGTYHLVDAKCNGSFFGGRSLTEAELERLKQALKLLSEAEKQLRVSSERSTWFTAALLQLGSVCSSDPSHSSSSRRQTSKTSEEDPSGTPREPLAHKPKSDTHFKPHKSITSLPPKVVNGHSSPQVDPLSLFDSFNITSRPTQKQFVECSASASTHNNFMVGNTVLGCKSPGKLDDIWDRCIQKCHSKTLRQLLHTHGKLVSISEVEGGLIASIAFVDEEIKSRAERFLSSITDSIEIVLRHNVEVRIGLLPHGETSTNRVSQAKLPHCLTQKQTDTTETGEREREVESNNLINSYSAVKALQEPLKLSRDSLDGSEATQEAGTLNQSKCSPFPSGSFKATTEATILSAEEHARSSGTKDRKQEIPMQRIHEIIDEQRLETAWLQVVEKGTPGSISRLKPERNQVLPQDGIYRQNEVASMGSMSISSQHWENELNHEIEGLKIIDGRGQQDQICKRIDHYPMSPSLLHDGTYVGNFNKDLLGYESGSGHGGCNGLFCWKTTKQHERGKVKQGTTVRSHKGRFLWFRQYGKSRKLDNRTRR